MGFKYLFFRLEYEFKRRSGWLRLKHPVNPKKKSFITVDQWKLFEPPFIIKKRSALQYPKHTSESLKYKADHILRNSILFFNSDFIDLGNEYDWVTNPKTNFKYNISSHWSMINDFNGKDGDIKYVWEKSRFSHLITLLRYDYHFDEDHSKYVFDEIIDWITKNSVNQGPNWKCSQEISIRLINWMYCLHFYSESAHLTESVWDQIVNAMYWHLHHVYHNIDFSRIAVRNNHAVTETMILALSDIMFPFIAETKKWSEVGRKLFEEEVQYQIYEDGAYIQHSMNYHRVLIQLLTFSIVVSERGRRPFSQKLYDKAYSTLNFLYQFVQNENGNVPNYGNNDGALFFPLTECVFQDFRPQINSLHLLLTGKELYYGQKEDFIEPMSSNNFYPVLEQKMGCIQFEHSGYYLFRTDRHFSFIRCCEFKDRPAHADNLHLDVWSDGINVLRDSGSFMYNSGEEDTRYFFGTRSHNTVMIEGYDQMLKGGRFIWYYWPQSLGANVWEDDNCFYFEGAVKMFRQIGGVIHKRRLKISKICAQWEIEDSVEQTKLQAFQLWHINPISDNVIIQAKVNGTDCFPTEFISMYSSFYGKKINQPGLSFGFSSNIVTNIEIQKED